MNKSIRWPVVLAVLLLAAGVGFWAYQAGVAHGIEQSGKIVFAAPTAPVAPAPGAYPYPYPYPYYGWHGPFGHGYFFGPLLFLIFGLVVARVILRGLFWRRAGYGLYGAPFYGGYGGGYGGCGPRGRFEEWHRQAHGQPPGPETGAPPAEGVNGR
ncbi:MAG TPA: hypothetical protein VGG20_23950 [Thermoanaerobaculia bacterium]|jgi:hypothetical protein